MERVQYLVFFVAIVFLGFIAGSAVVFTHVFPYDYLHKAYVASNALYFQTFVGLGTYETDLWRKARTDKTGVTIYEPGKAFNGYTLYSSGASQKTYLISMKGKVVHQWYLPYRKFWDSSAAEKSPLPASHIFIMRAYVYPNGDLLAVYIGSGDTPWGYGLVKMDKSSNLIWKYMAHTHHDLAVGKDGRIYALTQEIHDTKVKGHPELHPPRIDDYVVILSPDGKELKKIPLLKAMLGTPYESVLEQLPWFTQRGKGDYFHTNAVQVIGEQAAKNFPHAHAGDLLLSFREINTIAVLDVDKEKIVWIQRGPWIGQHDPELLPNGHITLFDNNGHFGPGGGSEVLEFTVDPLHIVWKYTGTKAHPFFSTIRSGAQRLPNGNTLITESDGGRLFEVTPDKQIVWEFYSPVRGGPHNDNEYIPVMSKARRLAPQYFDASFLNAIKSRQDKQ